MRLTALRFASFFFSLFCFLGFSGQLFAQNDERLFSAILTQPEIETAKEGTYHNAFVTKIRAGENWSWMVFHDGPNGKDMRAAFGSGSDISKVCFMAKESHSAIEITIQYYVGHATGVGGSTITLPPDPTFPIITSASTPDE